VYTPPCDTYLQVPTWTLHLDIKPADKLVLAALIDYQRQSGANSPSFGWICRRVGVPRRTLVDSLARLESRGLLTRERRFGAVTTYLLRPPPTPPMELVETMSHQCETRTGADSAPVQNSHQNQCETRTGPVQNSHPFKKNSLKTLKRAGKTAAEVREEISALEAQLPPDLVEEIRDRVQPKTDRGWRTTLKTVAAHGPERAAYAWARFIANDNEIGNPAKYAAAIAKNATEAELSGNKRAGGKRGMAAVSPDEEWAELKRSEERRRMEGRP